MCPQCVCKLVYGAGKQHIGGCTVWANNPLVGPTNAMLASTIYTYKALFHFVFLKAFAGRFAVHDDVDNDPDFKR